MVIGWAIQKTIDYCLAQIVNGSGKWTNTYIVAREIGGNSLFGEACLFDMSELQQRLITTTQLYDVVVSATDGKETIPDRIKAYPGKVLKWYEDWKRRDKANPSSRGSSGSNRGPSTVRWESD